MVTSGRARLKAYDTSLPGTAAVPAVPCECSGDMQLALTSQAAQEHPESQHASMDIRTMHYNAHHIRDAGTYTTDLKQQAYRTGTLHARN
jgi:hypothetical protein